MASQKKKVAIPVPSKDPEKEESKEPVVADAGEDDTDPNVVALTDEDRKLKEDLEMAVERASDADVEVQGAALGVLRSKIKESTSSMTAVPKPLKFLAPHFDKLKEVFEGLAAGHPHRGLFASVLSVLAMIKGMDSRESLSFRLQCPPDEDIGEWGHEYLRHLAGEIGLEREGRLEEDEEANLDDLVALVNRIVPYNMEHNAEPEAIDLLMEMGLLSTLPESSFVDADKHARVCLYLLRCADYVGDLEDARSVLDVALQLYSKHGSPSDALRVALRLNDRAKVLAVMRSVESDPPMQRQLALMLGRHGFRLLESVEDEAEWDDQVQEAAANALLHEHFLTLVRELDAEEPKSPEDIYKSAITGAARGGAAAALPAEDARSNLASSYVSAFANAGFGTDRVLTKDDGQWVFRNRGAGRIAASAMTGLLHLWNTEEISAPDKFIEAEDAHVRAGGVMSLGIMCASTAAEEDPALGLLGEYLEEGSTEPHEVRCAAIQGLGIAYAGSARRDVAEMLLPFSQTAGRGNAAEQSALAALAVGQVMVASGDAEIAIALVETLMEKEEADFKEPLARHFMLGLGLIFLGQGDASDMVDEILATVEGPAGQFARTLLRVCAYAGTGEVLQFQKLLHICAEHPEMEEDDARQKAREGDVQGAAAAEGAAPGAAAAAAAGRAAAGGAAAGGEAAAPEQEGEEEKEARRWQYAHQTVAAMGLGLVAMSEELGVDMAFRTADHLLQYGDPMVRRGVPMLLAMVHVSHPDYSVVDTLSKLSHDSDKVTAMAAILAMGICGAGTQNSRISGLLRQLVEFYDSDKDAIFTTRIAQALLYAGKGMVTMNPFHSDRVLMRPQAVASLLTVALMSTDLKRTLWDKWHTLLYSLASAMVPRFLILLDAETLDHVPIDIRVGTGVETVGQAGKPKSITGFQTLKSPVLMATRDRAEIADVEYEPLATVLEGVVLVRRVAAGAASGAAAAGAGQ